MLRRDYFPESLALYESAARADGLPTDEIERWRRLRDGAGRKGESPEASGRKRRRRRRGGRRRRRAADPPAPNAGGSSDAGDEPSDDAAES